MLGPSNIFSQHAWAEHVLDCVGSCQPSAPVGAGAPGPFAFFGIVFLENLIKKLVIKSFSISLKKAIWWGKTSLPSVVLGTYWLIIRLVILSSYHKHPFAVDMIKSTLLRHPQVDMIIVFKCCVYKVCIQVPGHEPSQPQYTRAPSTNQWSRSSLQRNYRFNAALAC
jgi:hypothetical protein